MVGSRSSLATLCGLLALASPARAEEGELSYKRGQFFEDGRTVSVSLGFREMLDPGDRARLKNGFATTVVIRAYLYEKSGGPPIAFSARTLRAVYDLWDEQFILRIEEPGRTRHLHFRKQSEVVDRLTSLYRLPIARLELVKPGVQYFVAVIAEVNPMSEALLAEVRRWLRNPSGDHRVGSESFFGSFVSIFINNKIRSAEKTYRVRSQPFYRRP